MLPELIIHNTLSLDNAYYGFDIDLGAHYSVLTGFSPDAVLAGSNTAKTGVETFFDPVPEEKEKDLTRPDQSAEDKRPVSVIVDSGGKLKGLLHIYRNLEHIRDVFVLVSETTPADYLEYLEERDYPYFMCGYDHVDLREALSILKSSYGFERIVSDSGGRLNSILIDEGIASSLSLIIAPVIAGQDKRKFFEGIDKSVRLDTKSSETMIGGLIHIIYDIVQPQEDT